MLVNNQFNKGQVVYIDNPYFNSENFKQELYVITGVKDGYKGYKYDLEMIKNDSYQEISNRGVWEYEEFLHLAH